MTYRITSRRRGAVNLMPVMPEFCRSCRQIAAKLPLSGKIMAGVFCGGILGCGAGMCRLWVRLGWGMTVFV